MRTMQRTLGFLCEKLLIQSSKDCVNVKAIMSKTFNKKSII